MKNLSEARKRKKITYFIFSTFFVLDFTEENIVFDPNNPLALDLEKWTRSIMTVLSSEGNYDLVFTKFLNQGRN